MTNDNNFKADKAAYDAANASAHTLSKDAGVKGQKGSDEEKTDIHKSGTGDSKIGSHTAGGDGTKARVDYTCPQCGKTSLHTEFPDQYETWVKCQSCGFFMGMSHDDWHRIANSPNINEKIRRMAGKQGKLT